MHAVGIRTYTDNLRWQFEYAAMRRRLPRDAARHTKEMFLWLRSVVGEDDIIRVSLGTYQKDFSFRFPITNASTPHVQSSARPHTFAITDRITEDAVRDREWETLSSASGVELLRRATLTRWWDLTAEEQAAIMAFARSEFNELCSENALPGTVRSWKRRRDLPSYFYRHGGVGVALWVKGALRGSAVVDQCHLGDGVQEALRAAISDTRFAPIEKNEASETRIEVTIISPLRFPVSRAKMRNGEFPGTDKAYYAKQSGSTGWFLPEVFTVRNFSSPEEFIHTLITEKVGISEALFGTGGSIFFADTIDIIETRDHAAAFRLNVPFPEPNEGTLSDALSRRRMAAAAEWLRTIQSTDGRIPASIRPWDEETRVHDWPRFAFTGFALATYGKSEKDPEIIRSAERAFEYLSLYAPGLRTGAIAPYVLTMAYAVQFAHVLERQKECYAFANELVANREHIPFDPLIESQVASALKCVAGQSGIFRDEFAKIILRIQDHFRHTRNDIHSLSEIAAWAEAVHVFDGVDRAQAKDIAETLFRNPSLKMLKKNAVTNIPPPWQSRIVGKILEISALPDVGSTAIFRTCLRLLNALQYDDDTLFCIPAKRRPQFVGGFRDSPLTTAAWPDAAGHYLLAGIRNQA